MKIDEDFTFPADYVIDKSPGWPQTNEPVIHALAGKSPFVSTTGDFLNLRFYPTNGSSWFGEFEVSERNDRSGICSTADPDVAFILSGWQPYRVNANTRSVQALDAYPVIQMKPDPFRRVIWLASFHGVTAVTPEGILAWKSSLIVSDDLRIVEINDQTAVIEGFVGGSIEREELELKDGKIVEGLIY